MVVPSYNPSAQMLRQEDCLEIKGSQGYTVNSGQPALYIETLSQKEKKTTQHKTKKPPKQTNYINIVRFKTWQVRGCLGMEMLPQTKRKQNSKHIKQMSGGHSYNIVPLDFMEMRTTTKKYDPKMVS